MHASVIRRQLGGLIPPKIATPGHLVSTTAHLILEAIHDSKLTFLPFFRDFFYGSLEVPAKVFRPS
jgi:hypothetical protein